MLLLATFLCALAAVPDDSAPSSTISPPAQPAPAPPAEMSARSRRVKVIVLDLKGTALAPSERAALGSLVTASLSELAALDVVSGAEVRELVALEGEKQAVGCEESMSCLAEMAGALGARIVTFGAVEKLGSVYILSLTMQDTKVNEPVGRVALQASDLDGLTSALPSAVQQMALPFLERERLSTHTAVVRRTSSFEIDLAFVGGLVAVAGAAVFATTYLGTMAVGAANADQQEVLEALKAPVAGKFVGAALLAEERPTEAPALYAAGAVETIGALGAAGGAAAFTIGTIMDGPELDGAGDAWRWGFIGGGLALGLAGVALDSSPSSSDNVLGVEDFAPVALELVGVTAVGVGLLANPFEDGRR